MIIAESVIEKTLNAALSTGADFAEVFIEDSYSSELSMLNAQADKAIVGELYGAGVRLFFGHEVIYVTTNDLTEKGLIDAALRAAASRPGLATLLNAERLHLPQFDNIHIYGQKPWESDRTQKLDWLKSLDQHSRSRSSLVTQVQPKLIEKFQKVQIANSKGLHKYDERAYSRLFVEAYVENNGVKESFISNEGSFGTYDILEGLNLRNLAEENVDKAVLLSKAKPAPAGEMPVIINNSFGGVIFHEACGHGLETTSIEKNASVFCGKLGEKMAPDCITAIDDGTIKNGWGSLNIDDEGNLTQKTVLIEKGVLKSYLVDHMGSLKTGYAMTGSGRRQNYKFAPASRMRNTYIAAGTDKFEDMVKDVDYGLFAKTMGGGSVSPGTGDYNFQVREAYMIRNGKIEEVVKGACLIGRGIETLGKITKVSADLKIAAGMCGSVSGTIPAAVGQPQVLVSSILVGGAA